MVALSLVFAEWVRYFEVRGVCLFSMFLYVDIYSRSFFSAVFVGCVDIFAF